MPETPPKIISPGTHIDINTKGEIKETLVKEIKAWKPHPSASEIPEKQFPLTTLPKAPPPVIDIRKAAPMKEEAPSQDPLGKELLTSFKGILASLARSRKDGEKTDPLVTIAVAGAFAIGKTFKNRNERKKE